MRRINKGMGEGKYEVRRLIDKERRRQGNQRKCSKMRKS
jgi:hypothetical protein